MPSSAFRRLISTALTIVLLGGVSAVQASQISEQYRASACNCPYQGDFNADEWIDIDDFIAMQNLIIGNGADIADPECPTTRGDYNADGVVDVVDLYELFDEYLSGGGNPPADPCFCGFPCELPHALGVATVLVESKELKPGTTDTIGVYVSNTTNIYGVVIPLVVRAITAYPSAISARFVPEGRVDQWMMGTTVIAFNMEDGECGGFGTPGSPGPSSPDAFLFLNTLDSRLPPGDDGDTASIEIIVTLADSTGAFEIDTTCIDPGHHFAFFEGSQFAKLHPDFVKGVMTIGVCDCPHQGDYDANGILDAVDFNAMINVLFYNEPDIHDPSCPTTRTNVDNSGPTDALDFNYMINHLFFNGPAPVDPCQQESAHKETGRH